MRKLLALMLVFLLTLNGLSVLVFADDSADEGIVEPVEEVIDENQEDPEEQEAPDQDEPAEADEPATEVEEPAAEVEEPAAEVEEPVAEVEEPVAEVEEPAAEVEEPVEEEPKEIEIRMNANPVFAGSSTGTFDLEGTVTWVSDTLDERPESVTLGLTANGNLVTVEPTWNKNYAENVWYFKYEGLPIKDSNGTILIYDMTVSETPDYETKIEKTLDTVYFFGDSTYVPQCNTTTFPNIGLPYFLVAKSTKHNGFVIWTEVEIPKENQSSFIQSYNAAINQNNMRINVDKDKDEVKFIFGDGGSWNGLTMNMGADGSWTATFDHTSVWATMIHGGFSAQITGFKITKIFAPEFVSFEVKKEWNDEDDQDGLRPNSVTVQLMKDGKAEGEPVELNEDNSWTYTWYRLRKYNKGVLIDYTVIEKTVPEGYEKKYHYSDGSVIIENIHIPSKIDIPVVKVWDDKENQDGVRPDKVVIRLYANGFATDYILELSEENAWKGLFGDLDEFENGELIEYTVAEEFKDEVDNYDTEIIWDDENGFIVTNTHEPETIIIEGKKTWDDADNQDGIRPKEITITIGGSIGDDGDHVSVNDYVITAADGWKWKIEGLPKYMMGKEIQYSVIEQSVDGYETVYKGKDIVNIHKPEEIDITAEKIWVDGKVLRPEKVEFQLYADGEKVGKAVVVQAPDWKYTWKGLAKKKAGKDIVYTVKEVDVPEHFEAAYTQEGGLIKVTNRFVIPKVDITAKKTWHNAPDKKPVIWFKLYRQIKDGKVEEVPGAAIMELKGVNEVKWEKLDKTDKDGNEYIFSVKEVDKDGKDFVPEGYEKEEDGLMVKNSLKKKPLPPTGQKQPTLLVIGGILLLLAGLIAFKRSKRA